MRVCVNPCARACVCVCECLREMYVSVHACVWVGGRRDVAGEGGGGGERACIRVYALQV